MKRLPRNQVIVGDSRVVLTTLPKQSVDCIVTSPPYFRLRNYQEGGQIGLEPHVDDYVHELLLVGRQLKRVLKPSGSFWLNLGDSYSRALEHGAPGKSLVLAPERIAQALVADGWIMRNKVVWAKTNPMPTSVPDRLGCTYEIVYFLVREPQYFFDLDAIRVPHTSQPQRPKTRTAAWSVPKAWRGPSTGSNTGLDRLKSQGLVGHPLGKNPGDVWQFATAGYRGDHHAVFPEKLVERPLLATCPQHVCSRCGQPWTRDRRKTIGHLALLGEPAARCRCHSAAVPGIVLDPFLGSGTVATTATRLGRDWLGIELNRSFAEQARARLIGAGQHPPPIRAA